MIKNQYIGGWSDREIKILKKYYKKGGTSEVIKHLKNRSITAIGVKARRLGIKYERKDLWSEKEIEILNKLYPLVGYRTSKIRSFIGTPSLLKSLPERSMVSIQNQAKMLNLKYEPQKGVPVGKIRCITCIEVRSKKDFSQYSVNSGRFYCKDCEKKIYESKHHNQVYRMTKSLGTLFYQHTGKNISRSITRPEIEHMLEKYGYKCFFEDEFCDNLGRKGLTIGHIKSIVRGGKIVDKDNIIPLCMAHNSMMSDLNLNELEESLRLIDKGVGRMKNGKKITN